MNVLSAYLAYRLVELMALPFEKWSAFKLGIIDENGKTIRKPILSDEKRSFGLFETIIRNIRVKMVKVIGSSQAAALLSTIYLIKEYSNENDAKIVLNYCLKESVELQKYLKFSTKLKESFEDSLFTNGKAVLQKGKYLIGKKEIELFEDLKMYDKFCGISIFKFNDMFFTKEEVKRVQ